MKEQLLMIPGTLCDGLLYKEQIKGLDEIAHCAVADHSSADSLGAIAQQIVRKVQGSFSVMGLSYGGILAFEMLRRFPDRINRLILLNTNHKKPSETTRINMQRFVGMAHLGEFESITKDILIHAMLHPENAKDLQLRETVLQMAKNIGAERFYNQVRAQLARPDSTDDLKNIQCPTLIITGRQDTVCPVALHEEMAALLPNATLAIIEDCGHLSTLEQPGEVNKLVLEWWKNQ